MELHYDLGLAQGFKYLEGRFILGSKTIFSGIAFLKGNEWQVLLTKTKKHFLYSY